MDTGTTTDELTATVRSIVEPLPVANDRRYGAVADMDNGVEWVVWRHRDYVSMLACSTGGANVSDPGTLDAFNAAQLALLLALAAKDAVTWEGQRA